MSKMDVIQKAKESIELASNILGPLDDEIKSRLYALLENPCVETWDDCHGIILSPRGRTLWQAIIKVDDTFPRRGRATDEDGNVVREWSRVPDVGLIERALFWAVR